MFKFTENIDLAKQLPRSMYADERQKLFLTLGQGYDTLVLLHFDVIPSYAADPRSARWTK